ncbi:hypothetical protein Dimus_034016 [Dionaea muscipula]
MGSIGDYAGNGVNGKLKNLNGQRRNCWSFALKGPQILCCIYVSTHLNQLHFEDERNAEDAVRRRDGYDFDGNRLQVEFSHGGREYSSSDQSRSSSDRGGISRRSEYRGVFSITNPCSYY